MNQATLCNLQTLVPLQQNVVEKTLKSRLFMLSKLGYVPVWLKGETMSLKDVQGKTSLNVYRLLVEITSFLGFAMGLIYTSIAVIQVYEPILSYYNKFIMYVLAYKTIICIQYTGF